jgi:hypothetical protein
MAAKVTAKDRKESATLSDGRFPVKNKAQAISALKLRGHARNKAERRSIIRRCMKFVPALAKKAWDDDKEKGLI